MTVKTQGGKVITKDGKVSCSCCEEPVDCCMYPAQALEDGVYTADDLPDFLTITSGDFQQTLTKTGELSPAYQGESSLISLSEGDVIAWDIFYNPGNGGDTLEFGQFCLIDGIYIKDQFADTYTVSGPTSGTVTRQSLCVWRGTGLTLTNFGYQWKINGNNKSGFQNTPVGSYAVGFTVS